MHDDSIVQARKRELDRRDFTSSYRSTAIRLVRSESAYTYRQVIAVKRTLYASATKHKTQVRKLKY